MFTGGGSILLAELVRTKRRAESFLFVPTELASVLNAIGGYVLAQATAQKLMDRLQRPPCELGTTMSDPVSLRSIPPDVLKLAHALSVQTGLSLNDVFHLALASGLLVEATKISPGPDGTLAGWDGPTLAKALRRHLSSAIDVLIEHGAHPYEAVFSSEGRRQGQKTLGKQVRFPMVPETGKGGKRRGQRKRQSNQE